VYFSDRNWLEFVSVIDATFASVQGPDVSEEGKSECSENIAKTRDFLIEIAKVDGSNNRSASLALLELEKNAFSYGITSGMILALGSHALILNL
jgi:N-terminal acetyltransferase B complex non-catalytic subunit